MRKGWFRIYEGLIQDTRLAHAAHMAGLDRAQMMGLWLALLDHASAAKPVRGSIAALDTEELSITLELPASKIAAALDALRTKKILEKSGALTDWHKYQSAAARRVAAHRARKKAQAEKLQKSPQPALQKPLHPDDPLAIAQRRARLGKSQAPQPQAPQPHTPQG